MGEKATSLDALDVARLLPDQRFVRQHRGCVMNENIDPATAKELLRGVARHVSAEEWAKTLAENPQWKGLLSPTTPEWKLGTTLAIADHSVIDHHR